MTGEVFRGALRVNGQVLLVQALHDSPGCSPSRLHILTFQPVGDQISRSTWQSHDIDTICADSRGAVGLVPTRDLVQLLLESKHRPRPSLVAPPRKPDMQHANQSPTESSASSAGLFDELLGECDGFLTANSEVKQEQQISYDKQAKVWRTLSTYSSEKRRKDMDVFSRLSSTMTGVRKYGGRREAHKHSKRPQWRRKHVLGFEQSFTHADFDDGRRTWALPRWLQEASGSKP